MVQAYRSRLLYTWLTIFCLLLTLLLAWDSMRSFTGGGLFFTVIMVAITLWFARLVGNRVVVNERSLVLHAPLRAAQAVEFRQLISVNESGRFLLVPTLLYHPLQPSGLVDLENVATLILPALTSQEELLATLKTLMPK